MSVLRFFFKYGILSLIIICVFVIGCDTTGDPIVTQPENVSMVSHTAEYDTLAFEKGIDAVPESNGIHLAWYPLKDPNIVFYNIYRQAEDETYFRKIKTIDIEKSTIDTSYVDDNAEAGLRLNVYYHYFITATNKDGIEGLPADTLKYMLINKPELDRPDGETYNVNVDGLPILYFKLGQETHLYILRIENIFGLLHYTGIFQRNYDNDNQVFDLSTISDLPQFLPGTYKWRIDSIGPNADNSGSESAYKVFVIL